MTTPTTLRLSDLAGPDADGWSDVAVFACDDISEPRFVMNAAGRCEFADGSSIKVNGNVAVIRLGCGRIVPAIPARIEMRGETAGADDTIRDLRRKLAEAGFEGSPPPGGQGTIPTLLASAKEAEEQVRLLWEALETALVKFNESDEERYRETEERCTEADKWRKEGDMYGWNFHQGFSAGCTQASIIFYRVKRHLEAALAATAPKGDTS